MLGMGPMEVAVILLVAFVFLGPQKMVQGARSFGDLVSQMRNMTRTLTDIDVDEELLDDAKSSSSNSESQVISADSSETPDGKKIEDPIPYNRKRISVNLDPEKNHIRDSSNADSED